MAQPFVWRWGRPKLGLQAAARAHPPHARSPPPPPPTTEEASTFARLPLFATGPIWLVFGLSLLFSSRCRRRRESSLKFARVLSFTCRAALVFTRPHFYCLALKLRARFWRNRCRRPADLSGQIRRTGARGKEWLPLVAAREIERQSNRPSIIKRDRAALRASVARPLKSALDLN